MAKTLRVSLAILVLISACVVFGPVIYNYELHPLAKFSDSVAQADSCDDLERAIASYVAAHPEAEGGRSTSGYSRNLWPVPTPEEGYLLFLHDESFFEDPQFEAVCLHADGRVLKTTYVAD